MTLILNMMKKPSMTKRKNIITKQYMKTKLNTNSPLSTIQSLKIGLLLNGELKLPPKVTLIMKNMLKLTLQLSM